MNVIAPVPLPTAGPGPAGASSPAEPLRYRGIHRQEDRDARAATRAAGTDKKFWHMIRLRIPLGTLTAAQYLELDRLSERVTYNRSLRATAGQSLQLHGISDEELKPALEIIRNAGLPVGCSPEGLEYALAGPPVPLEQPAYQKLRQLHRDLCAAFYPVAGADGVYPAHPPRKFTVGLALPDDNSANVHAHDVGLVLVGAEGPLPRVNVLVGGGLSMPGRRAGSYARVGTPLGSVRLDEAVELVRAVSALFRQHGQIATRRFTRLKYVVDELGTDAFRSRLQESLGAQIKQWIPLGPFSSRPWHGPHEQGDGRLFYGIKVPNGRIMDTGHARYKIALRSIVRVFRPTVILTPAQDVILAGLAPANIKPLEEILAGFHVPFGGQLSPVRAGAMACAGLPTCPLAVAESERVVEPLLRDLERELSRIGRADSPFTFRISGCSIGCIRPNMVDLGLVGRKPGHYDVFVGGDEASGRFAELYAVRVPLEQILSTVRPLLEFWAKHGNAGESFSGFYQRCFGGPERKLRLESADESSALPRIEQAMARAAARPANGISQERRSLSIVAPAASAPSANGNRAPLPAS